MMIVRASEWRKMPTRTKQALAKLAKHLASLTPKQLNSMNDKPKNPHAQALGRLGGKAGKGKAKARTTEQARAAVMVRWSKRTPKL